MLLSIYEFCEYQHMKGHSFVTGTDEITFACVLQNPHLKSQECLGKVCVLHHQAHNLQYFYFPVLHIPQQICLAWAIPPLLQPVD